MERVAIYPGSFDPITNGHIDIITRALSVFDRVVVGIANNGSKKPLFLPAERCDLITEVFKNENRVEVEAFSGLLVDYVRKRGAKHVVRGLRAMADFEYEFQLALMNRRLEPDFDTVFFMTDEKHLFISSSLVKEVAQLDGNIADFVPPAVVKALAEKGPA